MINHFIIDIKFLIFSISPNNSLNCDNVNSICVVSSSRFLSIVLNFNYKKQSLYDSLELLAVAT